MYHGTSSNKLLQLGIEANEVTRALTEVFDKKSVKFQLRGYNIRQGTLWLPDFKSPGILPIKLHKLNNKLKI